MEQPTERHWQTITIEADEFNTKLNQVIAAQASSSTLFSRLALIHQVAKAFATEAIDQTGKQATALEIDELTDPPMYGYMPDDEPVIIKFSYQP